MSRKSILVGALLGSWFGAALAASRLGVVERVPPPLIIGSLLALLLLTFALARGLRLWLRAHLSSVVLLHGSRLVGIAFLILYAQGKLPWAFAVPGGVGDIAVALAAFFVATKVRSDVRISAQKLLLVWNAIGLVDLLMVISTAVRLMGTQPGSMFALTQLPLAMLPTFLVPLLLSTHILIFAWAFADAIAPVAQTN